MGLCLSTRGMELSFIEMRKLRVDLFGANAEISFEYTKLKCLFLDI